MVALVVLATLAGVGPCAKGVHGEAESLVSLSRKGTKRHCARDEMLYDLLDWFHLVDVDGVALPVEEVAQEQGFGLVVDEAFKLLECLVVASARGELKRGYSLWVPRVLDAVLAPVELSEVWQRVLNVGACFLDGLVVVSHGIACYRVEAYAAYGACLSAEICSEQSFRQAD